MHLLNTKSLNFVSVLGILTFIIAEVTTKHLSTQYDVDFPEQSLIQNDKLFNNVRALIKRRLKENVVIKSLHLESDNNPLKISSASAFDSVPKTLSYVPKPVLVENWPAKSYSFGQITAVSIDPQGNPVVFHRANRYWDANTFNESNIYNMIENGPIQENTIYILDPKTGAIKSEWGEKLFYMPHGMTVDSHGNYWITDVAMHQAFKVFIN